MNKDSNKAGTYKPKTKKCEYCGDRYTSYEIHKQGVKHLKAFHHVGNEPCYIACFVCGEFCDVLERRQHFVTKHPEMLYAARNLEM